MQVEGRYQRLATGHRLLPGKVCVENTRTYNWSAHIARIVPRTVEVASELSRRTAFRLLVTANVIASSPILVSLIIEAIHFSETSILTRATRRNIPGEDILHSHRRENLKDSYEAMSAVP
jgi:hypothetical protein